jgi:hypothetical protein
MLGRHPVGSLALFRDAGGFGFAGGHPWLQFCSLSSGCHKTSSNLHASSAKAYSSSEGTVWN